MGVSGKMEVEIDIKHSGDIFHELFAFTPHQVSDLIPHIVHACNLHDGEFGKPGSIIEWEYTVGDKKFVTKQVVELMDEENKTFRYKCIEGDLFKDYKNVTVTLHVITQGDIDAVKWAIEFERFEDHGPFPSDVMEVCITMTRAIEAHHAKAKANANATA